VEPGSPCTSRSIRTTCWLDCVERMLAKHEPTMPAPTITIRSPEATSERSDEIDLLLLAAILIGKSYRWKVDDGKTRVLIPCMAGLSVGSTVIFDFRLFRVQSSDFRRSGGFEFGAVQTSAHQLRDDYFRALDPPRPRRKSNGRPPDDMQKTDAPECLALPSQVPRLNEIVGTRKYTEHWATCRGTDLPR
jgi:hypothetical protein